MQRRWGMGLCAGALVLGAACAVNVAPYHEDEEPLDAGQSIVDAGAEEVDAGAEDAGVDAGPQRPAVPDAWGAPVAIAAVNSSSSENHTSMTADLLRLCFTSNRSGGKSSAGDIWCAFRDRVEDPFGAPINQGNVNTAANDWMPGLSADGSEMFFASDRTTANKMNIFRAEWLSQIGGYGNVTKVVELNAGDDVWSGSPNLLGDGLTMYLESSRPGTYGEIDLWVTSRDSLSSPFGEIFNVNALNSGYQDADPGPSADGMVVVFTSKRPNGPTPGGSVWRSNRNQVGIWSAPVPADIEGASSFQWIASPRILSDGSLLFSATTSSETPGDLYIAPPKW